MDHTSTSKMLEQMGYKIQSKQADKKQAHDSKDNANLEASYLSAPQLKPTSEMEKVFSNILNSLQTKQNTILD